MGIKKKQVPGCGCCGSTVPPADNCCSGTIPATMTVQIGMSGGATFQPVYSDSCEYPCIDLQGTWALTRTYADLCLWQAETAISKVPGSCSGNDTVTVKFVLSFSDILGTRKLRFYALVQHDSYPHPYYETIQLFAEGVPSTNVCSNWTVDESITPTGGDCFVDFDSISVVTP